MLNAVVTLEIKLKNLWDFCCSAAAVPVGDSSDRRTLTASQADSVSSAFQNFHIFIWK